MDPSPSAISFFGKRGIPSESRHTSDMRPKSMHSQCESQLKATANIGEPADPLATRWLATRWLARTKPMHPTKSVPMHPTKSQLSMIVVQLNHFIIISFVYFLTIPFYFSQNVWQWPTRFPGSWILPPN
jgi:hypothetical protein